MVPQDITEVVFERIERIAWFMHRHDPQGPPLEASRRIVALTVLGWLKLSPDDIPDKYVLGMLDKMEYRMVEQARQALRWSDFGAGQTLVCHKCAVPLVRPRPSGRIGGLGEFVGMCPACERKTYFNQSGQAEALNCTDLEG